MRIAIVGPGRMGEAVMDAARERGHEVTARIGAGELAGDPLGAAEVAIEFTAPDAASSNLLHLARMGVPTVCGTTGWYSELARVSAAFAEAGVGLVYAPNFSLGAQLLLRIAAEAARLVSDRPEFDAWLTDTHHRHKRDSPSGTAARLQEVLKGVDPGREYPITSVRAGDVPGTHELHLDAAGEGIVIAHTARDRSIFARGAVVAAEWLVAEPRRGAFPFETAIFGERS